MARMRFLFVPVCVFLLSTSCVVRGTVGVKPLPTAEPVRVTTAVKAHLADGSVIVYPDGVTVENGRLIGAGRKYDLTLKESGTVGEVPLGQVVAIESFENTSNRELTVLASGGTTLAYVIGGALLAVAIFGSCPTVYADLDGTDTLEAELFSYSIAPLFEMNDIDRLRGRAGADGIVQLDIRNEALETHYLNRLELVEVHHAGSEIVVPDAAGSPVALGGITAPVTAVDRRGRDLRALLAARDDRVVRADPDVLARVTKEDFRDWIDLEVPIPAGSDQVALLLNVRNSLLNTVLFYDTMLADSGARSLDWLAKDLGEPLPAMALGAWYASRMGMRIEVWSDGEYRPVARLGDTGPIAWKDVAVILPAPHEGPLRVRLSSVADNWRIDQLLVATAVRRPSTRILPVAEVVSREGRSGAAVRSLAADDDRYLATYPGQSFRVRFEAGPAPDRNTRTFLLQSRGYYTEWVRGAWVASAKRAAPFTPGDDALLDAIRRWRNVQADFEARFDATRIPVR